jgi:hypothetical protein
MFRGGLAMRRAIPLLAVLCTGVALVALVVAVIGAGRTNPPVLEEIAPLDPVAAAPEIAELRESRGSILAGTSLATGGDAADFSTALANHTGAAPLPAPGEPLVELLRRSASEYEGHAQKLESKQNYMYADSLRRLAEDTRQMARLLSADDSKSTDPRPGFFSASDRQR